MTLLTNKSIAVLLIIVLGMVMVSTIIGVVRLQQTEFITGATSSAATMEISPVSAPPASGGNSSEIPAPSQVNTS